MSLKTIGLARLTLKQQVEIFGGGLVSLDSLWRAWASPAGHDPRNWSELAAPLLAGFAAYLGNLSGNPDRSVEESRLLWSWEDESKDPWCTGDLMSHEFIAWAYATYLDSRFARGTTTTLSHSSHSLVCF
jgi:hypothetical protein